MNAIRTQSGGGCSTAEPVRTKAPRWSWAWSVRVAAAVENYFKANAGT